MLESRTTSSVQSFVSVVDRVFKEHLQLTIEAEQAQLADSAQPELEKPWPNSFNPVEPADEAKENNVDPQEPGLVPRLDYS